VKFIALLLLAACTGSSYVTAHGARFDSRVDTQLMSKQEEAAVNLFKRYYGVTLEKKAYQCIEGEQIVLQDGFSSPWYSSGFTCGYYDALAGRIVMTGMLCEARLVYVHELIHMLQWCVLGRVDIGHTDRIWGGEQGFPESTVLIQHDDDWNPEDAGVVGVTQHFAEFCMAPITSCAHYPIGDGRYMFDCRSTP
jgi:hypothetical protein